MFVNHRNGRYVSALPAFSECALRRTSIGGMIVESAWIYPGERLYGSRLQEAFLQIGCAAMRISRFIEMTVKKISAGKPTEKMINRLSVKTANELSGTAANGLSEKTTAKLPETDKKAAVNRQAESLLDQYGNRILRLAYSYLHNMSDAEEVLQDTLIQYLKTVPELESEEHRKAWLLHVAGNLSKNRIRYNKVRCADELSETLAAEEREDLSFVWEAVKALPEKYREVIHLFYYEGYRTKQIAEILNRKETTVRSDLLRGREQLRTILKEAYDFEA